MLKNIPLSAKLVLILACPVLGFLWLASLYIANSYSTLKQMEDTVEASVAAQTVSRLITALQRERGATGVYLGSQGRTMANRLPGMRQATDEALSAVRELAARDSSHIGSVLKGLDELPATRSQVDTFAITNVESGARFTGHIRSLIGFTHAVERGVQDATLARALGGLNQFIEMKERAGRERAMLGVVFAQDRFDAPLLASFSRNLGEFSAYMEGFRRAAAEGFTRALDEKLQQPSALEVARLQRLAFEVPIGQSLGVDSEKWFETATNRIDLMGELEQTLAQDVGTLAAHARDEAQSALWMTVSAVVIALLVVVGLSVLIIRNIKLAVREVNQALLALSARDLTAKSRYEGKDEFGEISRNLNLMAMELQQVVQEISTATAQVATAAEESSAVTVQTSESIDRQRQGTELVVTAINEMSATVRDVARSTNDAAELSQQLNANTAQGRAEVESTIGLIRELSDQAEQTAGIIADLKRESDSISSVLDVIRGIADQTNLLALNAAIEAARAGEHGRGFAVVASEVRTLAQKTQESTGNIQNMIANLQGGADRAARSMQETLAKAQSGSSNIGRAGELLAEIAEGVSAISDRNLQIATAAEQQSAVAEDINRNIVEINDVAIQVSAGAEQTATTSLELARLAEQQQELVGRFKVA
ncbi:HAMP domain-containing protein [Stutzerimonas zhaodongensis]|jgi:methyl-accepting chemotaxis protein|uniref:HAMP domain-containing protein n=2 Tax=Stutzerimonas TaxID=2901164 RepID=A0A365PZE8_9GAMM|nr:MULTISPECIES: methyl-accepting chemotaxis protein [Stutzerimonas]ANF26390.1 chemotaxis protein [Stutzerimonas stutzeri]RBA61238.1 HAMP domain-containing protein [Stutzerimonas zhaodongensis]